MGIIAREIEDFGKKIHVETGKMAAQAKLPAGGQWRGETVFSY